jgi:radical SAM/Cys-rich protein
MTPATMAAVIAFATRHRFAVIDITGGAPELVPGIEELLRELAPVTGQLMLRTNLTALMAPEQAELLDLIINLKITLVASFPSTNARQADAQRGAGVSDRSVTMLQQLNARGYGQPDSGLLLHLVANPGGAFLPDDQAAAERRFKQEAQRRFGIVFNQLFTFANIPLGRFRSWLEKSGNEADYLQRLQAAFNPCTVAGLMCRTLLSVDWDGRLYDCDFNLAAELPLGNRPQTIFDQTAPPPAGTTIATGEHCYACTAGSGFT